MKKATLFLSNVKLNPSQIHKFRGFVGNLFRNEDLIHNHNADTGRLIYRYPLIQFKLVNNTPAIIAITDRAISVFMQLFMKLDQIIIDGETIPITGRVEENDPSEQGLKLHEDEAKDSIWGC